MRRLALAAFLALAAGVVSPDRAAAQDASRPPIDQYVFGGSTAPFGGYPFFAAVLFQSGDQLFLECGGTLIQPQWVLTAGHCVTGGAPDKVALGDLGPDGFLEMHDVLSVTTPGYTGASTDNDIALIRLATKSRLRPAHRVQPVNSLLAAPGQLGKVVGYGSTNGGPGVDTFPDFLQETDLTIRTDALCSSIYGPDFFAHHMLCAGTPTNGACRGDSGGPLLTVDERQWWAVQAVVNFGLESCGDAPGVFQEASPHDGWINGNIGSDRTATWSTSRLQGADRYATAVAMSQAFPPGVAEVFITTGRNFPDALGVGPVAAQLGAPILLVEPDSVPAVVAAELSRLDPSAITVVGGPAAISDGVLAGLDQVAPATRVTGNDRYSTTAALVTAKGPTNPSTVYLASGANFPDALAGGAAAAHEGAPVLLVRPDGVPAETAAYLQSTHPSRTVILGGTAAIGAHVDSQVASLTGGSVERIAGPDRWSTAALVALTAFPEVTPAAVVATGESFPDALAAVPGAFLAGAPILLTARDSAPNALFLGLYFTGASALVILGGPAAVSPSTETLIFRG